ncbi:hypothetical protein DRJ16_06265, partial [Candidatus Woesearchaeota archaeon]
LQARAHFAPLLGYRGPNGHVQVSGMLNHTTYNPTNPKRMSVDQLAVLLYEIDDIDRERLLEAIVDEFGYNLCRAPEASLGDIALANVLRMTLGIDGSHGDLARTIADALEDGEIDDNEKDRIRRATFQLRKAVRELEEALK